MKIIHPVQRLIHLGTVVLLLVFTSCSETEFERTQTPTTGSDENSEHKINVTLTVADQTDTSARVTIFHVFNDGRSKHDVIERTYCSPARSGQRPEDTFPQQVGFIAIDAPPVPIVITIGLKVRMEVFSSRSDCQGDKLGDLTADDSQVPFPYVEGWELLAFLSGTPGNYKLVLVKLN